MPPLRYSADLPPAAITHWVPSGAWSKCGVRMRASWQVNFSKNPEHVNCDKCLTHVARIPS